MVVSSIINKMMKERRGSGTIITKIRDRRGSSLSSLGRRSSRGSSCLAIEHCGVFQILMIGVEGVGKTTICANYVGDNIIRTYDKELCDVPVVSSVFLDGHKNTVKKYDIHISTSNGIFQKDTIENYKRKILRSDGFVLVYSKSSRSSYMHIIGLLADIYKIKKENVPVIIMGNKSDLNLSSTQSHEKENIFQDLFHFNVTAAENEGIQEAFKNLVQQCSEYYGDKTSESH